MADKNNLMRVAPACTVEYKQCSRAGVVGEWTALSHAKVISITQGMGSQSNAAEIELSDTRWNGSRGVSIGYMIRCRVSSTVLFQGFVVDFKSGYSTAVADDAANPSSAKEWLRISCLDYRWLYNRCSPVYGQVARGADDYNSNGTKKAEATAMRARRCIFNPSGYYNMDPDSVAFTSAVWPEFPQNFTSYVFSDADKKADAWSGAVIYKKYSIVLASDNNRYESLQDNNENYSPLSFSGWWSKKTAGSPWTAGKAINLLLSPIYNRVPVIVLIADPLSLPGLTHTEFSTVLDNIIVDGLGCIDAVDLICDNIGWTFREEYTMTGPLWVFYKPGTAAGSTRVYIESGYNPCLLHTLHTPAVGEDLGAADGAIKQDGAKLVCAMDLTEDIRPVVNEPWGLAAPHLFEITAELVPAWKDADLHIPTSGTTGLYYTESDLAKETDPNSKDFFKYHHSQGSSFLQDVGRKWALNESGKYTGTVSPNDYDRGPIFDFTSVGIDNDYIKLAATIAYPNGKRIYGPFKRQFMECLTFDKDSLNSVGIRLQWSKDGGTTWQELVCPVEILAGEAAVRLTIPNLAEIVDINQANIVSGDYAGIELNYFTSLADDKKSGRLFYDNEEFTPWNTRVRITATIQMDQRDIYGPETVYNGSPFAQSQIFDYADRFIVQKRCSSSTYYGGALPAWDADELTKMNTQMELIRKANEDMAIHGRFELDRLWVDGTNPPDIMLGDSISSLTGRNYSLSQTLGDRTVYPEIVAIEYHIQSQKQILMIRDSRLSIMVHSRQKREWQFGKQ